MFIRYLLLYVGKLKWRYHQVNEELPFFSLILLRHYNTDIGCTIDSVKADRVKPLSVLTTFKCPNYAVNHSLINSIGAILYFRKFNYDFQ